MVRAAVGTLVVLGLVFGSAVGSAGEFQLAVQRRDAAGEAYSETVSIDPAKTGVVVIDMWDSHYDDVFVFRAPNVIPRMNQTLEVCRDLGMQVVFAPAGTMSYYENPSHDGYEQRQAVKAIPYDPMPSPSGFNPPRAPYYAKSQHMTPPGVTGIPTWPHKTKQHDDVIIAQDDLIGDCDNAQELWNICADRGIEHLIFAGHATNWCLIYRQFGMINMRRYGFEPIFIRDLTDAMSCNGYNWETNQVDWSTSPDNGTAEAVRHNERWIGGSIQASQILQENPDYSYTCRVSSEPGLLSYWRMDCNDGYQTLRDYHGTQGLWNVQTVTLGVPGAVTGQCDTAALFDGSSAMIASPKFRTELPLGSPLQSLSSGDFSVEAWVQIGDGALDGSRRWIISHDEDDSAVDFLLGMNSQGRFQFVTRDLTNNAIGTTAVTQQDIDANRWFHLVGVQDAESRTVNLYVDGQLESSVPLAGSPRATLASLQIGSRGLTTINPSGGAVTSSGLGFFKGAIDEVAIYDAALSQETIQTHYEQELWVPPELPAPPPPPPPVSMWNLNEIIEGKILAAVGTQDGQVNGDVTLESGGLPVTVLPDGTVVQPSNHLAFGGQDGDYVDFGSDSSLGPGQITVGFWAKARGDHTSQVMLGRHATTGSSWEFAMGNNENAFFRTFVGGNQVFVGSDGAADPFTSQEFDDGQWHHFVGTHDGTNSSLYVDGRLIQTLSNPGELNDVSDVTALVLGQRIYPSWEVPFGGLVGGPLFILDHALSAEEIAALLIPPISGDANADGIVNDADAAILATNWQLGSGATWNDGDFNGDGRVNDADAAILASHWQEGVEGRAAEVPEPSTLIALLGMALFGLLVPSWRKPL